MPNQADRVILFCEDDDSVRNVTRRIISLAGYVVHAAPTGSRALEIIDELDDPVDLLVTDVVMPGMTGPDLANALRQRTPDLNVLFISGFTAEHAHVVETFGVGAAFLPKPYTSAELIGTIETLLSS